MAWVNIANGETGSSTRTKLNALGVDNDAQATRLSTLEGASPLVAADITDSTSAGRALITAADAAAQTALLNNFTSALKGLVPSSGGGTTNFLRADGTWAAAGGGGGTPGGSTSQLQYNNAGAFGGMSGWAWTDATRRLAINGGTVTTAGSIFDITQTLNVPGQAFNVLKIAITKTSAAGTSKFFDFSVDTNPSFYVDLNGTVAASSFTDLGSGFIALGTFLGTRASFLYRWTDGADIYGTYDTGLGRNAAGVVEVNSGTAGTLRDIKVRSVIQSPPASVTPAVNGELMVQATSNTSLTFKLKGTDGVVRSASLTLA